MTNLARHDRDCAVDESKPEAKVDLAYGDENAYDAISSPAGVVKFGHAENVRHFLLRQVLEYI